MPNINVGILFSSHQTLNHMEPIYTLIRNRARQIVSGFPVPDFYLDFSQANQSSRHLVETDPILADLKLLVAEQIENDFNIYMVSDHTPYYVNHFVRKNQTHVDSLHLPLFIFKQH